MGYPVEATPCGVDPTTDVVIKTKNKEKFLRPICLADVSALIILRTVAAMHNSHADADPRN